MCQQYSMGWYSFLVQTNTGLYLKQGQLRIEDIVASIKNGKLNHITLSIHDVPIYEPFGAAFFGKVFGKEKDPLLGFTLNLEARIFRVDSRLVNDKKILNALITKRDSVFKNYQKNQRESKKTDSEPNNKTCGCAYTLS